MKKITTRRKRGVLLSFAGLKRLQAAILNVEMAEKNGERFTLEELSHRINLSPKTLSRLWSLNVSVDHRTLKLCFNAFNLELRRQDYINGNELDQAQDLENDLAKEDNQQLYSFSSNFEDSEPQQEWDQGRYLCSYPDGPVPLDSPFYIERPPIEKLIDQEISQPGSLIRIRAPRDMGKSSLVLRLLAFAQRQEYHTVKIDCNQIDSQSLSNLNKFLRCFCTRIANELNIEPKLNDNWDEEIGSKLSCSVYFKSYLLKKLKNPLVLVLEQIECLFESPPVAQEFFPLLRSWYEEARRDSDWQKLRLVVVYSTETYVTLDLNRSPFNIGLPLRLPEFTRKQVQELAQRHGLNWNSGNETSQLMSLVGGHPALIRIALYYLCCQEISLKSLIQEALANGGIYRYHLWRHWVKLQENPYLAKAYTKVVTADESISLDPIEIYKLESIGLIAFEGERIKPRCELYRSYFKKQLSLEISS